MPLYDFECRTCGKVFEEFFKIVECPEVITCPNCGLTAGKIISAPLVECDDGCTWVNDLSLQINQGHRFGKPLTSRKQYHDYCKEKGIRESDRLNLIEV